LLVTSKSHYRRKPQKVRDAEAADLPIYVLRGNTPSQIRQFINTFYPTGKSEESRDRTDSLTSALREAQEAGCLSAAETSLLMEHVDDVYVPLDDLAYMFGLGTA